MNVVLRLLLIVMGVISTLGDGLPWSRRATFNKIDDSSIKSCDKKFIYSLRFPNEPTYRGQKQLAEKTIKASHINSIDGIRALLTLDKNSTSKNVINNDSTELSYRGEHQDINHSRPIKRSDARNREVTVEWLEIGKRNYIYNNIKKKKKKHKKIKTEIVVWDPHLKIKLGSPTSHTTESSPIPETTVQISIGKKVTKNGRKITATDLEVTFVDESTSLPKRKRPKHNASETADDYDGECNCGKTSNTLNENNNATNEEESNSQQMSEYIMTPQTSIFQEQEDSGEQGTCDCNNDLSDNEAKEVSATDPFDIATQDADNESTNRHPTMNLVTNSVEFDSVKSKTKFSDQDYDKANFTITVTEDSEDSDEDILDSLDSLLTIHPSISIKEGDRLGIDIENLLSTTSNSVENEDMADIKEFIDGKNHVESKFIRAHLPFVTLPENKIHWLTLKSNKQDSDDKHKKHKTNGFNTQRFETSPLYNEILKKICNDTNCLVNIIGLNDKSNANRFPGKNIEVVTLMEKKSLPDVKRAKSSSYPDDISINKLFQTVMDEVEKHSIDNDINQLQILDELKESEEFITQQCGDDDVTLVMDEDDIIDATTQSSYKQVRTNPLSAAVEQMLDRVKLKMTIAFALTRTTPSDANSEDELKQGKAKIKELMENLKSTRHPNRNSGKGTKFRKKTTKMRSGKKATNVLNNRPAKTDILHRDLEEHTNPYEKCHSLLDEWFHIHGSSTTTCRPVTVTCVTVLNCSETTECTIPPTTILPTHTTCETINYPVTDEDYDHIIGNLDECSVKTTFSLAERVKILKPHEMTTKKRKKEKYLEEIFEHYSHKPRPRTTAISKEMNIRDDFRINMNDLDGILKQLFPGKVVSNTETETVTQSVRTICYPVSDFIEPATEWYGDKNHHTTDSHNTEQIPETTHGHEIHPPETTQGQDLIHHSEHHDVPINTIPYDNGYSHYKDNNIPQDTNVPYWHGVPRPCFCSENYLRIYSTTEPFGGPLPLPKSPLGRLPPLKTAMPAEATTQKKKNGSKPKKRFRFYPPLTLYSAWSPRFALMMNQDARKLNNKQITPTNYLPLENVINSPETSPQNKELPSAVPMAQVLRDPRPYLDKSKGLTLGAFVLNNKVLPAGFYKLDDLKKLKSRENNGKIFPFLPQSFNVGKNLNRIYNPRRYIQCNSNIVHNRGSFGRQQPIKYVSNNQYKSGAIKTFDNENFINGRNQRIRKVRDLFHNICNNSTEGENGIDVNDQFPKSLKNSNEYLNHKPEHCYSRIQSRAISNKNAQAEGNFQYLVPNPLRTYIPAETIEQSKWLTILSHTYPKVKRTKTLNDRMNEFFQDCAKSRRIKKFKKFSNRGKCSSFLEVGT